MHRILAGIPLQVHGKNISMNKPKVLFVYDHARPEYWCDGLYMALQELEKDFEIIKYNLAMEEAPPTVSQDFTLGWGAFNSPVDIFMQYDLNREDKKGLCIAGNTFPPTGANNYDVLYYETKWYRPQISFHKNIVHAFGINSDLFFQSDLLSPIIWDYIGVGSLADWKRWDKMKDKKGTRLVVGEYQKGNEQESGRIALDLLKSGVMVSDMVSPFDLSNLYNWSRTLYMPSDVNGGGERAVLEARACGLNVEIEDDNPKLKEVLQWDPIPDYKWYASQLKKGILSCL